MNYSDRIVCFLDILGFKHHNDGRYRIGRAPSSARPTIHPCEMNGALFP